MADTFLDTLREMGILPPAPAAPSGPRSTNDLIDIATQAPGTGLPGYGDIFTNVFGIGTHTNMTRMKNAAELAKARLLIESKEATDRQNNALSNKDQQLAEELGSTYQNYLKQNQGDAGAATKALMMDPIFVRAFSSPHFKALTDHIRAINSGNLDPASTIIRGLTPGPETPPPEAILGGGMDHGTATPGPLAASLGLNPDQVKQLRQAATLSPGKTADTVAQQLQTRAFPPEPEEDKFIGKQRAAALEKIALDGRAATGDLATLQALRTKLQSIGGAFPSGTWRGVAAQYGIDVGDKTTDIQIAQSLIDRLIPAARQGLPGAASDKDVAMFRSSLPSLMRTPQGNMQILDTLEALASQRVDSGKLAASTFAGKLSPQDAWTQLQAQGSPIQAFHAKQNAEDERVFGFTHAEIQNASKQALTVLAEKYRDNPVAAKLIRERAAELGRRERELLGR